MIVAGFDLGTTTGYAVAKPSRMVAGVWNLRPSKSESPGARWTRFRDHLEELLQSHGGFDLIAFEEVHRHTGTRAAHVHGGLRAILEGFAHDHAIPLAGLGVGAIKKHATGKGNATKEAMQMAAIAAWQLDHCTHDEADARWLTDLAATKDPTT